MLEAAIHALGVVLEPMRLLIMAGGVVLGLSLGVIPGLGGVVALAILIPFTYHLDAYSAFALLLGMASVTTVSDLIPAVLFGVPGTVGAAATVLDGHPLAKQGHAARAFGAGYAASLIGGVFGACLLAVTIPVLRPVVLYLASPELLSFCIFGLSMVGVLSGKAPLKGLTAACLGLMLAMIGSDSQTGTLRWTFGSLYLWDHLPLVPVTLGVFALPELADMAISRASIARGNVRTDIRFADQWLGIGDALRSWWLILRCSWLGACLGAVPGLGAAVIDWIAYGHAIRTEKNTENFGHGDIRGVIAAIASDNAKEGGHLVPTIAFGVPAGASMALLLSAFLMHGLVPGPEMLTKHLDVTYAIVWTLTLAHVLGAAICIAASGLFARLALVRVGIMLPLVLTVIFIGAYQGSQSWGDLYSLALFGALGWVMKHLGWPRPPLILGFVLGAIFERYFFISTEIYGAAWMLRPVVLAVFAAALWAVVPPLRIHVRNLASTFGAFNRSLLRFGRDTMFTTAIIAAIVVAVSFSLPWPAAAKFVPRAAAIAALFFAGLNLLTEIFAPAPRAAEAPREQSPHAQRLAALEAEDAVAPALVRVRALRYFGWVAGFLVAGAVIGMLPALFLFVLLQMRLEFRERWSHAIGAACLATAAIYLLFDRTFSLPWPQSAIGDIFPALRDASGLV
ncbi:MAG TPA: tripartite tricarboxylate transporter permease [Stellaceae bacterium]|nr:tripartite tricarboxylate transporter permease [Stellaceae bacterium]